MTNLYPFWPAVEKGGSFLTELVIVSFVALLAAYLSYRIRLVPIVGYLVAGILVGPSGFGFVQNQILIHHLAELGVVLLLFTIGLEFHLDHLKRIWREFLVGGGLQVLLTTLVVLVVLLWMGVGAEPALYTGFLVALSSTAVVLSLLEERGLTGSLAGRIALAVLIFQDLAVVGMVLLLPVLAGKDHPPLQVVMALGEALLIVGGVVLLARRVVPPFLEAVVRTRRQDLFLLSLVAICFGVALITQHFGVSLALGAFLAGLTIAESPYSEQALSEILPLKALFSAIFFVSIGLLFNLRTIIASPLMVLALILGVLGLKVITTTVAVRVLGYPLRIALFLGLTLAQIGEFSFVLASIGAEAGLSPGGFKDQGMQVLIAVSVLLMAITPALMSLGERLNRWMLNREEGPGDLPPEASHLEDHVVVIGYGPAGQRLVRVLQETGIPFVVVELNPVTVMQAKEQGIPILYGDATRVPILRHAGVEKAKVCVVAINDGGATRRIVKAARFLNPTLQIIVRARFLRDVEALQKAGADLVIPEELETAVRIFVEVLHAYRIPEDEIEHLVNLIRSDDYRFFWSRQPYGLGFRSLTEEALHSRVVELREGAPAVGKTLEELNLRRMYGITVVSVEREGKAILHPSGEFRLEVGDRLVMVGDAEAFRRSAPLFRPGGEEAFPH